MDRTLNLFYEELVVPAGGYADTDTEFELTSVSGLADRVPLNAVIYIASAGTPQNDDDTEIVRITDVTGSNITVTRAQENTTARTYVEGTTYRIIIAYTEVVQDQIIAIFDADPFLAYVSDSITAGAEVKDIDNTRKLLRAIDQ